MSTALSPLVSEFETTEQEASYTAWLRGQGRGQSGRPAPGGGS